MAMAVVQQRAAIRAVCTTGTKRERPSLISMQPVGAPLPAPPPPSPLCWLLGSVPPPPPKPKRTVATGLTVTPSRSTGVRTRSRR